MSTELREWDVVSMLEWGTTYFRNKNVPDPRHSIEWLLAETLQVKRLDLYLKFDRPLSREELNHLRPLIKRRARHEPLQYIIGYTIFRNARIKVTPDVLIPRLETEQLVELILDRYSGTDALSVLDIGTGSGCIPIALKMEQPGWTLQGLDISPSALAVARDNAALNQVDVNLFESDILRRKEIDTEDTFDLIVSNPPYVLPKEKDKLELQVKSYEPSLALYCESFEEMYGSIIRFSEERLISGGSLYLEVHELHAEHVASLFHSSAWTATIKKDYEGKQRFVVADLLS